MPYILLVIGLILGLYGLYRFFLNADPHQMKAFFLVTVTVVICIALFFMAVTGRLPGALALLAALWPLGMGFKRYRQERTQNGTETPQGASAGAMSHAEALDILGLPEGASREDIEQAYKRLVKKLHPDQKGSAGLTKKLNEARKVLLQ